MRPLLASFASIAVGIGAASPAWAKQVHLEWKAIAFASKYEIKLNQAGRTVLDETVGSSDWAGELAFGLFSYQVRAIDRFSRPGVWSEAFPLVVMPTSPQLKSPADSSSLALYSEKASVKLEWQGVPEVSKYEVKVLESGKVVFDGDVSGTETRVEGLADGEYIWEVTPLIEASEAEARALGLAGDSRAGKHKRRWEGAPARSFTFEIEHEQLDKPSLVFPTEAIPPPRGGSLTLRWKKVSGAQGYEVKLLSYSASPARETASSDSAVESTAPPRSEQVFTTGGTSLQVPLSKEGFYGWEVRALADYEDPKDGRTAESSGPKSVAGFELNRNASFFEGGGYVAFSSLFSPFTYKLVRSNLANLPTANGEGSLSSEAVAFRGSGEYYFHPSWGVGLAAQDTAAQIEGQTHQLIDLAIELKYRIRLSNDQYGWFFAPKLGFERRVYLEEDCLGEASGGCASFQSQSFAAFGPSIGFDLRKQLGKSFSLGVKLTYFYPLGISGLPEGLSMTPDQSRRNLSIGVQSLYWLAARWGLGLGAFIDHRSISFGSDTGGGKDGTLPQAESIGMDAYYLFASLVYTFGK